VRRAPVRRGPPAAAVETFAIAATTACGVAALLLAVRSQVPHETTPALLLAAASSVGSTLVLGWVVGAMVLGHWYLVTPDLPVAHLGRLTGAALAATYVKLALLAVTAWYFRDRLSDSARSFATIFGIGHAGGPFQSQLDFLWLLARLLIGLVGPAALCHMTLATVRLKATQPATGILYAATVLVLMGELFAFVGERSFSVVLVTLTTPSRAAAAAVRSSARSRPPTRPRRAPDAAPRRSSTHPPSSTARSRAAPSAAARCSTASATSTRRSASPSSSSRRCSRPSPGTRASASPR
jgi:hypothetical protein